MKILHSYANAFLFGVLPLLAAAASSTSTSGEPGNERQLKPVHPKALFDARLVKRQQRARGSINPKILDKNEIISPKIVNGEEVEAGTYPWFVSLRVGADYVCGGFLVAPQFVLTAAHCLWLPPVDNVVVGALCRNSGNCGQDYEEFAIEDSFFHPGYDPSTTDNDFALLKLSGNSTIEPVKIDNGLYSPNYNTTKANLWVIGT
jgi:hypothetical protein